MVADKLEEILAKYRVTTEKLIAALVSEEYDALDELFTMRQTAIEKVKGIEYTAEDFALISSKLDLKRLEDELGIVLNQKRSKVRAEIDKFSEQKNARKSYTNQFSVDSIYFNKKI